MDFKIDESIKNSIQKNKYKRHEWSALRKIDIFLYVLSIYLSLFTIFYVLNRPTFSFFYGKNGAITISGRILTLATLSILVYLLTYIPHLILHLYMLFKTGQDNITRIQESFKIEDNHIVYEYLDLLDKKRHKAFIEFEDVEKVSYIEAIKKIIFMGPCKIQTINPKTKDIIKEETIDNFVLYAYFKPSLLKELEKRELKIEINFFA